MSSKKVCKWCGGIGGRYVFSAATFYYCVHCQPEKAAQQNMRLTAFGRWQAVALVGFVALPFVLYFIFGGR